MYAPDVVRRLRRNPELTPEIADMVADCSVGVVIQIFVPYKVNNHVVSKNPAGIHDEQGEDVKLLRCQPDFLSMNRNEPLLQAEVQFSILNFSHGLPGILHRVMRAGDNHSI